MFLDYKLERDEGNCKSPRLDTSLKKTLIDDESDVAHLVEEPGCFFYRHSKVSKDQGGAAKSESDLFKRLSQSSSGPRKVDTEGEVEFFPQIFLTKQR